MTESLGLKYDKFVKVDVAAVQRAEKLGKLHTLLITKVNEHLTVPKWTAFRRGDEPRIAELFGKASVFDFAKNYFGFQNKAGDFPDLLYVYTFADTKEQRPALVGKGTPALEQLKKVKGDLKIRIDETEKKVTLDFTGKTTHTEMATAFTEALKKDNAAVQGFKDAEVKWSSIYSAFVVTAGASAHEIGFVEPPDSGTDISDKLGLSSEDGARTVAAYPKIDGLQQVLEQVSKRNDSYFYVTLDYELDSFEKLLVPAEWVHETRGQYCFVYSSTAGSLVTQPTFTSKFHSYNGLLIEYTSNPRLTNGKSLGLFSSVDYGKNRGNLSFAYNEVPQFRELSIKEEEAYDTLTDIERNRANGYVTVRRLTNGYTWYMPGNIMGTDTPHLNVYAGNFVITTLLQQGFAMWLTNNKFPAVSDATALQLYTNSLMQQAANIGLAVPVDALDVSERQQISSIFLHNLQAEAGLTANGYFTEIGDYDAASRCINIKIAYIANVPIRKLCIKLHALRG